MMAFITRWLCWGVAAAAVAGCSTTVSAASPNGSGSPLTRSIESFVHAFSVQQVRCGSPGAYGHRSCQVEFTDDYGVWWATLIVKGSRVIGDPGGVADWLCATACSNPPPMTGNTGKPGGNTGTKIPSGQTGVTGIGGVVKFPPRPKKKKPPPVVITTPTNTGVVTTNTGVVSGSGNTGVVTGTGTGVVSGSGSGNTSTVGATGATGVVYGTGSTGPGG